MFVLFAVILFSTAIVVANEMSSYNINETEMTATAKIIVPTGIYWNGTNFIKVESNWLRVVIHGQQMKECSFNAQMDPHGNYVLTFGGGECITIYSNGRTLYYDGITYSKK